MQSMLEVLKRPMQVLRGWAPVHACDLAASQDIAQAGGWHVTLAFVGLHRGRLDAHL